MTCGEADTTINGVDFLSRKYVTSYAVYRKAGGDVSGAGDLLPVYQSECLATALNLSIPGNTQGLNILPGGQYL
jgi:hypothetical protein